jgi:hypothetical protein
MTVRFPNGQAIQYNTALFALRSTEYTDLYTKNGGKWISQVPNNCIIESVEPCNIYNPLNETNIKNDKAIEIVISMIENHEIDLPAAYMKRLLADYSIKKGKWLKK